MLLVKEKKGLFLGQGIFFVGKGNGKCFIMQIASSSSVPGGWGAWGMERPQFTDYLIGSEQNSKLTNYYCIFEEGRNSN